jgi:hypothetical protein
MIVVAGAGLLALASGCPSRGIPSYDPCTSGQTCALASDRCVEVVFTTAVASMCTTQRCVVDADCPLDARGQAGACLGFDAALTTCFERCTRLADCATGWSCEAVSPPGGGTEQVCVPSPS